MSYESMLFSKTSSVDITKKHSYEQKQNHYYFGGTLLLHCAFCIGFQSVSPFERLTVPKLQDL